LPAAIATMPSNGPVASSRSATSSPVSSGDAFLQVLRGANTVSADQETGIPVETGRTEPAPETESAPQPLVDPPAAAAKAAPDAEGTAAAAPKVGAARPARAVGQGPVTAKLPVANMPAAEPAPVTVAMLPAIGTESPSRELPTSQASSPSGGTAPTSAPASNAASGIGARPAQHDAGPAASAPSPPIQAADAASPQPQPDAVSPAKGPLRAIPLTTADQPVQTIGPAPSPGLAVSSASLLPEQTATASGVAAPAGPTPAPPAAVTTPAAQIAPALLSLGQAADGTRQLTLRLHPAELGVVQVQIGRTETGSAQVEITVEKADTLQALLRDQPQLHRALDDAGLPAAGRTIVFHAVAPPSAATGGNPSPSMTPNQAGSGNTSGNGPHGGGKSGYPGNEPSSDPGSRRQGRPPVEKTGPAGAASYRIGLDMIA